MSKYTEIDVEILKEGGFEYVEKGEGPVILVLHGLFGALSNFRDVLNHFSNRYRVVIPILPIFTMPLLETNVKNLARYIREFVRFKRLRRFNLLGNSLGGHVALIYTSENIGNVNTLILTGSSGLYENAFGDSFPRREDYNYIREKVAVTFYDPKHATKELVDECYKVVNDKSRLVRIIALAKSAVRHNMSDDLPKLKVPSCLIWGKDDIVTPPNVAKEFQQLLPQADLYWIDHCGHAPMMEHPHKFNEIMSKWLDQPHKIAA